MSIKQICVVLDVASNECMYVNGVAWRNRAEPTVYAFDIVEAADGEPIELTHTQIESCHTECPERLEEALSKPVQAS